MKKEKTERYYLNQSELKQLEGLQFTVENQRLEKIRDFFLFCAWTGLRYSDASKLTPSNFSETEKGLRLNFVSQKTKKPAEMYLRKLFNGKPEKLINSYLEKYKDFYFSEAIPNAYIFFGTTNQRTNMALKEIAQMINIREELKEKLSTHCARHSFGTCMATKVTPFVLQDIMQHSSIRETLIYVHMSKKTINDELDKIDNWS